MDNPIRNLVGGICLIPNCFVGRVVSRHRQRQQIILTITGIAAITIRICTHGRRIRLIGLYKIPALSVSVHTKDPTGLHWIWHRNMGTITDIDRIRTIAAVAVKLHQIVITLVIYMEYCRTVCCNQIRFIIQRSKSRDCHIHLAQCGAGSSFAHAIDCSLDFGIFHIKIIVDILEEVLNLVGNIRRMVLHNIHHICYDGRKRDMNLIFFIIKVILCYRPRYPTNADGYQPWIKAYQCRAMHHRIKGRLRRIIRLQRRYVRSKHIFRHLLIGEGAIRIFNPAVQIIVNRNRYKFRKIIVTHIRRHCIYSTWLILHNSFYARLQFNRNRICQVGIVLRVCTATQLGSAICAQYTLHQRQSYADSLLGTVIDIHPNAIFFRMLHLPLVGCTGRNTVRRNHDLLITLQI